MHERIQKIQKNLNEIQIIMTSWIKYPLFVRKDNKKDTVLCLEEKSERTHRRYSEIESVAVKVHR